MFSHYNGVSFELKKRMSHHWQANIGLTLSKVEGRLALEHRSGHAPERHDQHGAEYRRRRYSARTRTIMSTATAC